MDIKVLVSRDRPVFSIPFDQATGPADDLCDNVTVTGTGKLGGPIVQSLPFSLHMDSGTITIPTTAIWMASKTGPFSVEFWMKSKGVTSTETKVLNRGNDYVYYRDGEIGAVVGGYRLAYIGVDTTQSHYVALTYDSGVLSLYVDDNMVSGLTSITNIVSDFTITGSTDSFSISMLSGYDRVLTINHIVSRLGRELNSVVETVSPSAAYTSIFTRPDYTEYVYDVNSQKSGFKTNDYVALETGTSGSLMLFEVPLGLYTSVADVVIDVAMAPAGSVEYSLDGVIWTAIPARGLLPGFKASTLTLADGMFLMVRANFSADTRLHAASLRVYKESAFRFVDSDMIVNSTGNSYRSRNGAVVDGTFVIPVVDKTVTGMSMWINLEDTADRTLISAPVTVAVAAGVITASAGTLIVNGGKSTSALRAGFTHVHIDFATSITSGDITIGPGSGFSVEQVQIHETVPTSSQVTTEYLNSLGAAPVMGVSDTIGTVSDSNAKMYTHPWAILNAGG